MGALLINVSECSVQAAKLKNITDKKTKTFNEWYITNVFVLTLWEH